MLDLGIELPPELLHRIEIVDGMAVLKGEVVESDETPTKPRPNCPIKDSLYQHCNGSNMDSTRHTKKEMR